MTIEIPRDISNQKWDQIKKQSSSKGKILEDKNRNKWQMNREDNDKAYKKNERTEKTSIKSDLEQNKLQIHHKTSAHETSALTTH